jgi:hypothetical protein
MVPSATATADRREMVVHDVWALFRDAKAVPAVRCHQKPHFQPRIQSDLFLCATPLLLRPSANMMGTSRCNAMRWR